MQLTHLHYNLCKHFFSNKIIAVWNSLPNIIVNAESTNIFNNRLDRFWVNQEFKFDWPADIARIRSWSLILTDIKALGLDPSHLIGLD